MSVEEARTILDAEYRPPIRRGDLRDVEPGRIVGIVDGVFEQDLAVSPTEIRGAIHHGVRVFGSSSMGALRASEVPEMVGVGRIWEMYARSEIVRDDEVALLFDPESGENLTEPLVNIRYAVRRLVSTDSLSEKLGSKIVAAAEAMHYKDRVVPCILREAGLPEEEVPMLSAAIKAHNLKREDAHRLLERIRSAEVENGSSSEIPATSSHGEEPGAGPFDSGRLLLWEFGDAVEWSAVVDFLVLTGDLTRAHRRSASRSAAGDGQLRLSVDDWKREIEGRLRSVAARWGWTTGEEVGVTVRDLGLETRDLQKYLLRVLAEEILGTRSLREDDGASSALRLELLLDDLELKRALARCGSLQWLVHHGRPAGCPVDSAALEASERKLCLAYGVGTWQRYLDRVSRELGSPEPAERLRDDLAAIRARASALRNRLHGVDPDSPDPPAETPTQPIVAGPPNQWERSEVDRIAKVIGVTRIALIGELTRLGVQISQVSRPDGTWSSTYGSGKGESSDEAVLGGVFEELEKWSQERFSEREAPAVHRSYLEIGPRRAVDPELLPLPYDSIYRPDLEIDWSLGWDELSGSEVYVPSAVVHRRRYPNDIMLSRRAGRRISDTNGLAAGFDRRHAVLHGVCEVIERHATRLADLRLWNPGTRVPSAYRFIEMESARGDLRALLSALGAPVSLLDITSEVRVPTVLATLLAERASAPYLCQGWGCHPDPNLAIRRAVLEACQTLAVTTAGGREDLSLRARSLGRHERPRPMRGDEAAWWFDPDRETIGVGDLGGLDGSTVDLGDGLSWVLDRLRAASVPSVVVMDLSQPEVPSAHVVRVVIPDLESINPFHTGLRGRLVVLEDLLPRLPHGSLAVRGEGAGLR